jgi:DNA-binding transcriptional LysR family regulator
MKSKLNHLYLMKLFISIVQKGSFAEAARTLSVAPAKASKDIHYLETSLGSILLNRSTRSLNITDAGELFYQSALEIVEMHSQMLDNLAMLKHTISGELRITAPVLWGEVILAPIIIAYKQRYPLVKFSAEFSNTTIDIFKENIHIAFRSTNLRDEPYLARYIADDEFVLCASKEYLSSKIIPKTPQDLLGLDLITLVTNESKFTRIDFNHKGQAIHQHLNGELHFNNKQVIYETVKAGLGYAVLPRYLVLKGLDSGNIVEMLADYQIKGAAFYALYTQRRKESALVNHFIDFVGTKVNMLSKKEALPLN